MNIFKSKRLGEVAFCFMLFAFVAGCGLAKGKKDAEAVVTRHFLMIATNGFTQAVDDYGAPFFTKTSKAEWTTALTKISGKLGDFKSYSVTSWQAFEGAGTSGSGTTVKLQCDVVYSKHTSTEQFILFKGVTDSDYKIVGHQINSMALLTE